MPSPAPTTRPAALPALKKLSRPMPASPSTSRTDKMFNRAPLGVVSGVMATQLPSQDDGRWFATVDKRVDHPAILRVVVTPIVFGVVGSLDPATPLVDECLD